jgi:hypothetical protein
MKVTEKQIPKEARWAARSVIGDHVSSDTIDRALAAALNAWEGVCIRTRFIPNAKGEWIDTQEMLSLPLSKEGE